ncbi:hypothetical protein AMS68_006427 [Peltaster fructicola]|uniref:Uncharacterized protein n=1 Tax=Peltaster fructicola TaxID=286661 RepID=A0A6H0Y2P6_9PEZI|nr:hypothetical protein AMS68_006427 [Peltaster fructicola]
MPDKRPSDAGNENDDIASKKQRQSHHPAEPELFTRTAAADTALEIDIMILDYLAWRTTECLLDTPYNASYSDAMNLQRHLELVDSWITDFNIRHSSWRKDDDLCHRLTLLSFSTLYFRRLDLSRHTPDRHVLRSLRTENVERAAEWIGCRERVPSAKYDEESADLFDEALEVDEASLEAHRQRILASMNVPHRRPGDRNARFYGSPDSLSLLDIIPTFMRIIASVLARLDAVMESYVVNLLCDLMRQACLEQYLIHGARGCDAIDQALAWGCYSERPDPLASDWKVDRMFRDATDSTEMTLWTSSKDALLNEFMGGGDKNDSLQQKLERLANHHPLQKFDLDIRTCIQDLRKIIALPILAQLEKGQLKDMDQAATVAFLKDCGICPGFFSSTGKHH